MTGGRASETTVDAGRGDQAPPSAGWPTDPGEDPAPSLSRWRVLRRLLVLGWLLAVVVGVLLGERPSTMSALEKAVAAGRVHVVTASPGLGPDGTGYAVVDLRWRDHGWRYRTQVLEARPRRAAPSRDSLDGVTAVIGTDVGTVLRRAAGDTATVRVRVRVREQDTGLSASVHGWRLPGWMGFALLGMGLLTLVLLVQGPQPWRATRWAWFWLMAVAAPLGLPAFLALSGPTWRLSPPRRPSARLTGGRALVLALLLSALLRSAS